MIVESMFLKKFTLYILKECWEKRLRDERKKVLEHSKKKLFSDDPFKPFELFNLSSFYAI